MHPRSDDQAAGLRALFAPRRGQLVPLVDNPLLDAGESLIDLLVGAYLERGLQVLVVDAGARAKVAGELAQLNLAACIEPLSAQVGWLDARGLVAAHLDHRGSAARLVERLHEAAPQVDVILLRAPVAELARVIAPGARCRPICRPLVCTDLQQQNLTAAYAAMKWLAERADARVFGLLVAGHPELALTRRIARQLGDCAERFLGAALPSWAGVDPASRITPALRRLARDSLLGDEGADSPRLAAGLPPPHRPAARAPGSRLAR